MDANAEDPLVASPPWREAAARRPRMSPDCRRLRMDAKVSRGRAWGTRTATHSGSTWTTRHLGERSPRQPSHLLAGEWVSIRVH